MKDHQPSRTAEYMAFFRAMESVRPAKVRLFTDPFAVNFIGPQLKKAVSFCAKWPICASLLTWYVDRRLLGSRTSAVARTRLIDDALHDALREDIAQVVILGAGFDCRAYRLAQLERTTIFEVDHPATRAAKIACLRTVLQTLPDNVRYIENDLNNRTLLNELAQVGFRDSDRAIFLWEGVSHYLTADAVDSVLRIVASCCPGSRLIFTYIHAGALDGSVDFEGARRIVNDVARLHEPWIFGLRPERVRDFLRERGLSLETDLSAREYRSKYFGNAAERMKGYDFYHVAVAHVLNA